MHEVVKSFNILYEEGVMVQTPSGERKRVYAAVVQYQGDWKWHKDRFGIKAPLKPAIPSPEIISPAAHLKSAFRFLSVAMSVPSL